MDFSINTNLAIQKALLLADPVKPKIHLLRVLTEPSVLGGYSMHGISYQPAGQNKSLTFEPNISLQLLKKIIERSLPDAAIDTYVTRGDVIQNEIIQFASQLKPQLIVIGKHEYHNLLPSMNDDYFNYCLIMCCWPGFI